MCTIVEIRRPGLRPLTLGSVRELARHLKNIVSANPEKTIDRMAEHCLCPVDIKASAEASGYEVVAEPCTGDPDIIIQRKAN